MEVLLSVVFFLVVCLFTRCCVDVITLHFKSKVKPLPVGLAPSRTRLLIYGVPRLGRRTTVTFSDAPLNHGHLYECFYKSAEKDVVLPDQSYCLLASSMDAEKVKQLKMNLIKIESEYKDDHLDRAVALLVCLPSSIVHLLNPPERGPSLGRPPSVEMTPSVDRLDAPHPPAADEIDVTLPDVTGLYSYKITDLL